MPYFEIPDPIVIDFSGPHALRYLNARLTNDISKLAVATSCLAAALTPQGKTEAIFSVVRLAEDRAKLVCSGGVREEVIVAFKRYIVADRVNLKDESNEWQLVHVFGVEEGLWQKLGATDPQSLSENLPPSENQIIYPRRRLHDRGYDVLLRNDLFDELRTVLKELKRLSTEEVHLERIKAGIPSFPEELNTERLFLEGNLLQAISFNKGCYTGQEVVERVASRGKVPRVIKRAWFKGANANAPQGENLFETLAKVNLKDGSIVGEVLSYAFDREADTVYALLSIKNDPDLFGQSIIVGGTEGIISDS